MDQKQFIEKAIDIICSYYFYHKENNHLLEEMPREEIHRSDIYVVWACKTLQNNKALLSTPYGDSRYFEVTYNGDKKEFYLDCYVKEFNRRVEL